MPSAPAIYETLQAGDGVYDYLAANDSIIKQNPLPKDGKPIKVILASSYLNFLISNKVVVAQKFWKPGAPEAWKALDKKAQDILQKAFPDRKIVAIDPRAINIGGGGIHCNTQQKPLVETRK
jgi:agmatine deiminase